MLLAFSDGIHDGLPVETRSSAGSSSAASTPVPSSVGDVSWLERQTRLIARGMGPAPENLSADSVLNYLEIDERLALLEESLHAVECRPPQPVWQPVFVMNQDLSEADVTLRFPPPPSQHFDLAGLLALPARWRGPAGSGAQPGYLQPLWWMRPYEEAFFITTYAMLRTEKDRLQHTTSGAEDGGRVQIGDDFALVGVRLPPFPLVSSVAKYTGMIKAWIGLRTRTTEG